MDEQPPAQIRSSQTAGTVLQAAGALIAVVGLLAAVALTIGDGPVAGVTGLGIVVAGAVVYGLGQTLWVLAAILLELWVQGRD